MKNLLLLSAVFALNVSFLSAAQPVPLLQQRDVEPMGLKRIWYHQVKVLSDQSRVQHAIAEGGQMFITTTDANLHCIDTETGQWLWSRGLGKRKQTITEPAVNSRFVCVCNGMDFFIFSRKTGKQLYQQELAGVLPSAPLQMSENYAYIPLNTQTIQAIILKRIPKEQKEIEKIQKLTDIELKGSDDPELRKIVEQFEDAKRLVRKEIPAESADPDADIILDDSHRIPITCAAMGLIRSKPVVARQIFHPKKWSEEKKGMDSGVHLEMLTWVVQGGYLFTAEIERLSEDTMKLRYRINSSAQTYFLDNTKGYFREMPGHKEMVVSPAINQPVPANEDAVNNVRIPSIIVTGGKATYVFAVGAQNGNVIWQYPARGELTEPIAVIGRDVYAPVVSSVTKGGLHHFDLLDGAKVENGHVDEKKYWFTPDVRQFVAASQKFLYVLNSSGFLNKLDRTTGKAVPQKRLDSRPYQHVLFNVETDQIFLLTDDGLIQCLRETEAENTLRHRITCAEYAEIAAGHAFMEGRAADEGQQEAQAAEDGGEKPAEPVADNGGKRLIKLWWEDSLPQ